MKKIIIGTFLIALIVTGCIEYIRITAIKDDGDLVLRLEKPMAFKSVSIEKWSVEKPYNQTIYEFGIKDQNQEGTYIKEFIFGEVPENMIVYSGNIDAKIDDLTYKNLYSIEIRGFGQSGYGFFIIDNDNGYKKILNLTYEEAEQYKKTGIINNVNYW